MIEFVKKSTQFWSLVGKLAALASLVWIIIQFVQFFKSEEYEIIADGDYMFYHLPISFEQMKNNLFEISEKDIIWQKPEIKKKYKPEQLTNFSEIFKIKLRYLYDELENYEYILWFTIKNKGAKEVIDLNLELPINGLYKLEKVGEATVHGSFNRKIKLGSLLPANELKIMVWTRWWSPYRFSEDSRITHPNGVIYIEYPEKVGGFFARFIRIIKEGGRLTIFVFVLLITSLILSVIYEYFKKRSKKLEQTTESSENTEK